MNLPTLLEKISTLTDSRLTLTKEIRSINNARNCLVHRKGIVYPEKDINNTEDNTLTVHWIRPFLYQEADEQKIEMPTGGIITHESPAFLTTTQHKKSFEPYQVITFNYKEVVDITYMCYWFGKNLVDILIQFLKENKID